MSRASFIFRKLTNVNGWARTACQVEPLESRAHFSAVVAGTESALASGDNSWGVDGPQVGSDAQGNFVATWLDAGADQLWARVFDPAGAPKTAPVLVANNLGKAADYSPVIAVADNGNFVVTWWNNDGLANNAEARFFTAAGQPLTAQVAVTSYGKKVGAGMFPVAAMDDAGNAVIAWDKGGGGSFNISAQRFDPSGNKVGKEIIVANDAGNQMYPSVAMDGGGGFLVTWESGDGSGTGIYGQRYSKSGSKLGSAFRVNSTTGGSQTRGREAMDRTGDFVVVWQGAGFDGAAAIYGQRYNASGQVLPSMDNPSRGEFRVDLSSGGNTSNGFVAMDRDSAAFVVAWDQSGGPCAQAFDSVGARIGGAFQVGATNVTSLPQVVIQPVGHFIIAWDDSDGLHEKSFLIDSAQG